jgi:hypothetical protein
MPEDWYKISQPADKNFSSHQWIAIHHEFTTLVMGMKNREIALLTNDDNSVSYDYYFSPAAAVIAKDLIARYGGTRCESPIGVIALTPILAVPDWEHVFRRSSK